MSNEGEALLDIELNEPLLDLVDFDVNMGELVQNKLQQVMVINPDIFGFDFNNASFSDEGIVDFQSSNLKRLEANMEFVTKGNNEVDMQSIIFLVNNNKCIVYADSGTYLYSSIMECLSDSSFMFAISFKRLMRMISSGDMIRIKVSKSGIEVYRDKTFWRLQKSSTIIRHERVLDLYGISEFDDEVDNIELYKILTTLLPYARSTKRKEFSYINFDGKFAYCRNIGLYSFIEKKTNGKYILPTQLATMINDMVEHGMQQTKLKIASISNDCELLIRQNDDIIVTRKVLGDVELNMANRIKPNSCFSFKREDLINALDDIDMWNERNMSINITQNKATLQNSLNNGESISEFPLAYFSQALGDTAISNASINETYKINDEILRIVLKGIKTKEIFLLTTVSGEHLCFKDYNVYLTNLMLVN